MRKLVFIVFCLILTDVLQCQDVFESDCIAPACLHSEDDDQDVSLLQHHMVLAPTCEDAWLHFNSTGSLFTSTQIVKEPAQSPHDFDNFDHGSWWQGLFVDPPSRFAFCTIEKNGCTSWAQVLGKMYRSAGQTPTAKLSQDAATFWGKEGLEKVFQDAGATRAVMIREPLTRFASVYLDKCVTAEGRSYCWPNNQDDVTIPFSEAVEWYLKRDDVDDGHWKMQSKHCELHQRIHEYTIIGYMTKDKVKEDSQCIMEHAGLQSLIEDTDLVKGVGARQGPNHQHSSSNDHEEEVLKKLYTPEAARRLISHFKLDYDTFNLPREPSWVAEATGEWYNIVPPIASPSFTQISESVPNLSPWLSEEDDIVASAMKAGYMNIN